MITHILFDNNGVLTTSDHERTYKKVAKFLNIPESHVQVLFKDHVKDLDTGKITHKEFYSLILDKGGFHLPVETFKKIHLSGYIPKPDVQKFALELKKKYKIAILSNFGDSFWELYDKTWGLDKIFEKDKVFVSSDLKLAKPDKKIYLKTLKDLGVKAENCVFIDDALENVESANKLGINGIQFNNLEQVKKDLSKLGVN